MGLRLENPRVKMVFDIVVAFVGGFSVCGLSSKWGPHSHRVKMGWWEERSIFGCLGLMGLRFENPRVKMGR